MRNEWLLAPVASLALGRCSVDVCSCCEIIAKVVWERSQTLVLKRKKGASQVKKRGEKEVQDHSTV